jgi:hypothetical protein
MANTDLDIPMRSRMGLWFTLMALLVTIGAIAWATSRWLAETPPPLPRPSARPQPVTSPSSHPSPPAAPAAVPASRAYTPRPPPAFSPLAPARAHRTHGTRLQPDEARIAHTPRRPTRASSHRRARHRAAPSHRAPLRPEESQIAHSH